MVKRIGLILIVGLLAGAATLSAAVIPVAAQDPTPMETSEDDLMTVCRDAVEGMAVLTADLRMPDHLLVENPAKTAEDFDVNAYFDVLDHLTVEEGYFLDYVYQVDFMGGYPVLYVLPEGETPFATIADYGRAVGDGEEPDYLDRIMTNDTAEGYVQLVVLDVMAEQFYLHWHAGYNDSRIICDEETLDTLLTSDNDFGQPLPEDVQTQARDLDVAPTVTLDDNTAQVRVLLFTKWGGFYEVWFTISRDYPRAVYDWESEALVPYDCGVMF